MSGNQRTLGYSHQGNRLGDPDGHAPLPPDVWIEIIPYLSPTCLANLSATCLLMVDLAQRFVFKRITFHPFLPFYTSDTGLEETSIDRVAKTLDRMRFLTSPRIAPQVHECLILPQTSDDGIPISFAIQTILQSLSSFPNFQKLFMKEVYLDISVLEELCLLPPFLVLSLEGCYGPVTSPPDLAISVKSLICERNNHGTVCGGRDDDDDGEKIPAFAAVAPLLNAEVFESLAVGTRNIIYVLRSIDTDHAAFRNLLSLDITESILSSGYTESVLRRLNNLRHLRLRHSDPVDSYRPLIRVPPSFLPSLNSFEGSYLHAPMLTVGRPVQTLTLWPVDRDTRSYAEKVFRRFVQRLDSDITTLDVGSFINRVRVVLKMILDKFLDLEHLSINAHPSFVEPMIDPNEYMAVLVGSRLPLMLEVLDLGVRHNPAMEDRRLLVDILTVFTSTCLNSRIARFWHKPYRGKNCMVWRRPDWAPLGTIVLPSCEDLSLEFCEDVNDFHVRRGKYPEF